MNGERAALVTGASRGIGHAVAAMLVAEGYGVTITARNEEAVHGAASTLAAAGGTVRGVPSDVSDPDAVARLVAEHRDAFGRLDVLVHSAGTFAAGTVSTLTPDVFDGQIAANLRSAYLVAREAIPLLREAGGEHGRALLVNVASVLGHYGQAVTAAYSAAKGGLLALTQSLHGELAPDGVRVTAISPAFVATAMTAALPHPRETLIQPDDVAEAVRFLLRTSPACVVPEIPMLRTADRLLATF